MHVTSGRRPTDTSAALDKNENEKHLACLTCMTEYLLFIYLFDLLLIYHPLKMQKKTRSGQTLWAATTLFQL